MSKRRKDETKLQLNNHDEPLLPPTEHHEPSNLRGDYQNIAILFFLYLLQGIPIGLAAAIPMLLQNRGTSYKQQAEFSFAHWPFSLKLLWAPIVDSLFMERFGRRKSWLVPTQYLIGLSMLLLSAHVNRWLGGNGESPNVFILTVLFFSINFLAATQDIAVDGWALTMLKRCNVGHASTCNSVGQTAGYFLGYVVFIALESKDFCNNWLRAEPSEEGLVTLSGFLWFWGIVFLITTTLVALLKHEKAISENDDYEDANHPTNLRDAYALLWRIVQMRPVQLLALILLTAKVSFAAFDAVTGLKLIDAGVPKDKLAILVIPLTPLQIVLPLFISKYTTGPQPMNIYIRAIPYRLVMTIIGAAFFAATPAMIGADHQVPLYYFFLLTGIYGLYQIALYSMFVAAMAFFARISDPGVGGTYMTLLNTLCNLGGNWPNTLVLWLVDVLTWRRCEGAKDAAATVNLCANATEKEACAAAEGTCVIETDGYYLEIVACLAFGILWYHWARPKILRLQQMPVKAWHVVERTRHKRHSR